MTADEARRVERVMRSLGLQGIVAPVDPDAPAGEWRVYDEADPRTRRDKTAEVLAAIAEHVPKRDTGHEDNGKGKGKD